MIHTNLEVSEHRSAAATLPAGCAVGLRARPKRRIGMWFLVLVSLALPGGGCVTMHWGKTTTLTGAQRIGKRVKTMTVVTPRGVFVPVDRAEATLMFDVQDVPYCAQEVEMRSGQRVWTVLADTAMAVGLLVAGGRVIATCPKDSATGDIADGCAAAFPAYTLMFAGIGEMYPLFHAMDRKSKRERWEHRGDVVCPNAAAVRVNRVVLQFPDAEPWKLRRQRVENEDHPLFVATVPLVDAAHLRIHAGDQVVNAADVFAELAEVARDRVPRLDVRPILVDDNGDQVVEAGEAARIEVRVTNHGTGSAYITVRAQVTDDVPWLEIGAPANTVRVAAGESHLANVTVRASGAAQDATLRLVVEVAEARGFHHKPIVLALQTARERLPEFKLVDIDVDDSNQGDASGDGDGKIERGEMISLMLTFQNVGEGSADPVVKLASGMPGDLHISRSERSLGPLKPGKQRSMAFSVMIGKRYVNPGKPLPLTVTVTDSKHGVLLSSPLPLWLNKPVTAP